MRIILLRHGQSLGNVDELAYCRIPDHALPLTPLGEEQARAAAPRVKTLVGDAPVAVYVSPYVRTRSTLRNLALGSLAERVVYEPRLREQDWGNLQDPVQQEVLKHQRHAFGHFFFRLPNGESGADVDDRLAAFLADLETRMADPAHPSTALVVSHGLTIRLLCRRLFGWSIELFESLSNLDTCEDRVLSHDGTRWHLDRPFTQWRHSPDDEVQAPLRPTPPSVIKDQTIE
ncbi:histidine phosphatase family protein [Saccharothrix violaceirubra]|uniref:Broad specificity phosphatase PhoE n=1 Tax=Saccharothrix violaceirubra TaxID=413306 RepID=A0A7W7WZ41_9PSEU|nr:histidine phosphatase family protein [Saccharothrix violaceirubra]MBB4968626.1 broad specificity phosphatase PhoE [Saccharothrix violaceirubra]